MGKIVISTNATLDGVVQDPDGSEGSALGSWFSPAGSTDREAWAKFETAEAMQTEALLLGRRTYEWFATRWASRGGDWADRLNSLPKYLVSSTLSEADATWGPTTIMRGDVLDEVSKVKQERDGDILIYGSYELGQALLEHDLIDELRLFVYPVVLGAGKRLFGTTSGTKPLRLVDATTIGDGLALLIYEANRSA